jgi:membrane protein DedA with SNARE-associated domain
MLEYVIGLLSAYGYYAIFALLMVGVFGLPIPDEILMSYVGLLVFQGKLGFFHAVAAAWLGTTCGVTLNYFVGRTLGHAILVRLLRSPEKAQRLHLWFQRRGKWALPVSYFIPAFRHYASIAAGITRLDYPIFALFAYSGGFLWTCTYISLGYFLGKRWFDMSRSMHVVLVIISVALAASIALYFLIRWLRSRSRPPAQP